MKRRAFFHIALGSIIVRQVMASVRDSDLQAAVTVLSNAVSSGQVRAASLLVRQREFQFAEAFGAADSVDDPFLIASISKPMSVAALMTLYDQQLFQLDDPVAKFIPEFRGDGREKITILDLLTHVSGLPDQLPENQSLRQRHAELSEFVDHSIRTPLLFSPGTQYSYSSMGILLAAEIAERLSAMPLKELMDQRVFQPLGMNHSALGLGNLKLEQTMQSQVVHAAPESGAGDAAAKEWDWNSIYWRSLGSPWGGVHASAVDVGRFLDAFLHPDGKILKRETAQLMIRNHNRAGLRPRGLGFSLGSHTSSPACSDQTFGHGGSTGTLAWADPESETMMVVLTTLPSGAAKPHPRQVVSDRVAAAVEAANE